MVEVTKEQIQKIGDLLNDPKRPLKERFRALFTLRNIGGPLSIENIEKCFCDGSTLLKHELAYCLGQMQDKTANPVLVKVLENVNEEAMVRHEAAEALGAIGSPESLTILQKYSTDNTVEVAETCQLALERIKWLENQEKGKLTQNPYHSVDPAPPTEAKSVDELKNTLLDESAGLFDRYRAMFSLRNVGSKESVLALGEALDCGSALFRHEIAFVLGQMQDANAVPYLKKSLEKSEESAMVRHECAEALGAIATDECTEVLNKYLKDNAQVVKESCEIALDMCEYENSAEFQYANALSISAEK